MERLLNLLRLVSSVVGADGPRQITALHQGNDEIGGLADIRDRQIEMIHAGTDVGDDRRNLRTAVWRSATHHEYPDRLIEFTNALAPAIKLQFGMESSLKEAVLDFVVAEARSFGGAPNADVGIISLCRTAQRSAETDSSRGEDDTGVCVRND